MPGHPFYQSSAWQSLRKQALARDRYHCVLCGANVGARGAARVDHIKPRAQYPGLALVLSNVRTLCATCDNRRHAADKAGAANAALRGADANGLPLSPAHHWHRAPAPPAPPAPAGGDRPT